MIRTCQTSARLVRGATTVACTGALVFGCSAVNRKQRTRADTRPLYAVEATSEDGMVATGSVEATRAGVEILERGGNAVDAAVAAAFTLGVADPGGSGLGGLTYVLISTADGRHVAVDGSTPAPYVVDHKKLAAIKQAEGRFGHAVVSVPTTLATLAHSLEKYGTMDLAEVLRPAIETARRGYRLTPNGIGWAQGYMKEILASRYMRFIVLENGLDLGSPGDVLCNPDLAATLQLIADEGADTMYRGSLADTINADMVVNGGYLRKVDLARYRVREAPALQSRYRDAEILSFPNPGAGGEVVETLNILETFPSALIAEHSPERLHMMIEATRLAQADHAAAPVAGRTPFRSSILDPSHARERAALITPGRAIPEYELGATGPDSILGEHTTHISVIDRDGNSVALTQTLCRQFGSKVATPGLGFPHNSCLEFLEFENRQSPIYLKPGGTFPTSMAPTIIRTPQRLVALGSAGSDRIPPSISEVVTNLVDRNQGIRDAVVEPRVVWNSAHDPPRLCIEVAGSIADDFPDALRRMGFETMYVLKYPPEPVSLSAFFGGVNAAAYDFESGVFSGVGDPRRDGFAAGPRTAAAPGKDR